MPSSGFLRFLKLASRLPHDELREAIRLLQKDLPPTADALRMRGRRFANCSAQLPLNGSGTEPEHEHIASKALAPASSSKNLRAEATEVLHFLNEKTSRNYRGIDTNLRMIEARLRSGASVQDCKSVIGKKVLEWKTDPKMNTYLRPATLFNPTKFEQYLGELGVSDAAGTA